MEIPSGGMTETVARCVGPHIEARCVAAHSAAYAEAAAPSVVPAVVTDKSGGLPALGVMPDDLRIFVAVDDLADKPAWSFPLSWKTGCGMGDPRFLRDGQHLHCGLSRFCRLLLIPDC